MVDKPTRTTEPADRLSRIAAAMTDAAETHAEHTDDDKAVVMLVDGHNAVAHLFGYSDDVDAMVDMFVHLRAIARANGRDIEFIGVPNDVSGIGDR